MSQSTLKFASEQNLVSVQNGKPATTSNVIASTFGKRHADVLRAVKGLECSQEFSQRNFALAEFIDEQGKSRPSYVVSRDGFMFLAMGFTGAEAAKWKEQYINAFNAMEAELLRISNESRASYATGAYDILTAAQAEQLRIAMKAEGDKLPPKDRALFMRTGWSKLKSHFGCSYRDIPQREFTEALSIIGRHAAGYTKVEYNQTPVADITNAGYRTECLNELMKFAKSLPPGVTWPGDDVVQRLADGYLASILRGCRWMVSFGPDGNARASLVPSDAYILSPSEIRSDNGLSSAGIIEIMMACQRSTNSRLSSCAPPTLVPGAASVVTRQWTHVHIVPNLVLQRCCLRDEFCGGRADAAGESEGWRPANFIRSC